MEVRRKDGWKAGKGMLRAFMSVVLVVITVAAIAQSGEAGLQQANQEVRRYFQVGTSLMYAVCGVLGLIGAVRVYQKWSNGHPDTSSTAAAWFGACIFLVIVVTVIRAFFGI